MSGMFDSHRRGPEKPLQWNAKQLRSTTRLSCKYFEELSGITIVSTAIALYREAVTLNAQPVPAYRARGHGGYLLSSIRQVMIASGWSWKFGSSTSTKTSSTHWC